MREVNGTRRGRASLRALRALMRRFGSDRSGVTIIIGMICARFLGLWARRGNRDRLRAGRDRTPATAAGDRRRRPCGGAPAG